MPSNSYTSWNKANWVEFLIDNNFESLSNRKTTHLLDAFNVTVSEDPRADARKLISQIKLKNRKKVMEAKKSNDVVKSQNIEADNLLMMLKDDTEMSEEKDKEDDKDVKVEEPPEDTDDDSVNFSLGGLSVESGKSSGSEKVEEGVTISSDNKADKPKSVDVKVAAKEKKSKSKSKDKNSTTLFSTKTVATKDTKSSISTTWDVSSLVSDITDLSFDDYDADLTGCEYEGFDPIRTLTVLAAHAEADKVEYDDFLNEMKFLAPFIAMRGTNRKSIVERTREDKRPIIESLLKRYKVVDNNNKGGFVSKDTIILSRIVSCFPIYVSMALSTKKIEAKCKTDGLPLYLHHSAGASLIPKSDTATYNLWLTWSKAHDKLINGKDADDKKVEQFGKIVHESNNVEDDKRARLSKLFTDKEKTNKVDDSGTTKGNGKV